LDVVDLPAQDRERVRREIIDLDDTDLRAGAFENQGKVILGDESQAHRCAIERHRASKVLGGDKSDDAGGV